MNKLIKIIFTILILITIIVVSISIKINNSKLSDEVFKEYIETIYNIKPYNSFSRYDFKKNNYHLCNKLKKIMTKDGYIDFWKDQMPLVRNILINHVKFCVNVNDININKKLYNKDGSTTYIYSLNLKVNNLKDKKKIIKHIGGKVTLQKKFLKWKISKGDNCYIQNFIED